MSSAVYEGIENLINTTSYFREKTYRKLNIANVIRIVMIAAVLFVVSGYADKATLCTVYLFSIVLLVISSMVRRQFLHYDNMIDESIHALNYFITATRHVNIDPSIDTIEMNSNMQKQLETIEGYTRACMVLTIFDTITIISIPCIFFMIIL